MYNNVANIISQEINNQVLGDLYKGHTVEFTKSWDRNQPTNGSFYGTRKQWYETLMIQINDL
jgi:hypothetical protein